MSIKIIVIASKAHLVTGGAAVGAVPTLPDVDGFGGTGVGCGVGSGVGLGVGADV